MVLAGLALLPLVIAQGGHGTQWIGRWALSSRLQAIPQYYLTGYTGSALGHGVELLVALPVLAGLVIGGRALAGASGEEAAREREGLAAMLVARRGGDPDPGGARAARAPTTSRRATCWGRCCRSRR